MFSRTDMYSASLEVLQRQTASSLLHSLRGVLLLALLGSRRTVVFWLWCFLVVCVEGSNLAVQFWLSSSVIKFC